ncbi:MAG: DUF881 domain-containing protein [Terracoccus sp.]
MSTTPPTPPEPPEPPEALSPATSSPHERDSEATRRRPDASMTLLTSMLERPLDGGYQEAADRRSRSGLPAATSTRSVIVIVMALLTGFLFALGAQSVRAKPTAGATLKDELVSRIESLQTRGTTQESQIAALGKEVRGYEDLALTQAGSSGLTDTISRLEVAAGAVPLSGPGVTLTLDDAAALDDQANAGARPSSGFDAGRVSSADLQILVNGLWGSGAEAIAINGHRLTTTAAIRFAGQAIIVDFRPLSRPYVVSAIGDPDSIQKGFGPSFAGVYLGQLESDFAIRATLAAEDTVTVPGDSGPRLSVAQALPPDVGSGASGAVSVPAAGGGGSPTDGPPQ